MLDAFHMLFGMLTLTEFFNIFIWKILFLFLFSTTRSQKEEALHFRVTKSNECSQVEKVHSPEKQQIILSYCRSIMKTIENFQEGTFPQAIGQTTWPKYYY